MTKSKQLALSAVLVALALGLSYLERFLPLQLLIPLPGVKLGLANIVTMMALYFLSGRIAFSVLVVRCLLGSLFGIALLSRERTGTLICMGFGILVAMQSITNIGVISGWLPTTGVTAPFVSYGGTSLVSSLCLAGLLQGVASLNEDDLDEDTRLATMDVPGEVQP